MVHKLSSPMEVAKVAALTSNYLDQVSCNTPPVNASQQPSRVEFQQDSTDRSSKVSRPNPCILEEVCDQRIRRLT
jgi:hypothetical protein